MSIKLKENDKAPDFELKDQFGKICKLKDYLGKWVLIYFYPKDDTPGCTKQACAIRDSWQDFKNAGIVALGISKDSVTSHKKFADKHSLPFIILSDEDKKIVEKYGVWQKKKFMGREFMGIARTSFLINTGGKIIKIYEKVNPNIHAKMILNDFRELNLDEK